MLSAAFVLNAALAQQHGDTMCCFAADTSLRSVREKESWFFSRPAPGFQFQSPVCSLANHSAGLGRRGHVSKIRRRRGACSPSLIRAGQGKVSPKFNQREINKCLSSQLFMSAERRNSAEESKVQTLLCFSCWLHFSQKPELTHCDVTTDTATPHW